MDTGTALMMGPRQGVAELIRQLGGCQPGTQGHEMGHETGSELQV